MDRVEYIPIATADQLAEPLSLEFERQESKNRLRNSFNGSNQTFTSASVTVTDNNRGRYADPFSWQLGCRSPVIIPYYIRR